ncbi:Rxt3-domain-containing protein [Backusella circina FSU 941]|nr:Rxt3-domain-containing protein [Backusella circina FSU 941]
MSENESAIKHSEDKTSETQHQNKKIKLTETAPLVLDKSQEEAIDKLVQNSHLAKEKEEQVNSNNSNSNKKDENLLNKVSLPPITNTLTENKNTSSITSEQLLYALTSSVPTAVQNDKNKDKPSTTNNNKPTLENESNVQSTSTTSSKPSSSSSSSSSTIKSTSSPHLLSNVKLPTTSSSSLKAANLGFNSLPDISAALRRLSSSAPVMDQLTTSEHRKAGAGSDSASEILGNALAAVAARPSHLAAFTANISNLLQHHHSTGFEDTQKKLAAAVMRKKIPEEQEKKRSKLVVNNTKVWKSLEGMEEKSVLGFYVYTPQFLLPNLENHINGTVEIRVPSRYLTYETDKVQKRALWGTDIYTDDSDVVAMIIHSGKYQPPFKEKEIDSNDPFALMIAGKAHEALEETRKRALTGKTHLNRDRHVDHDVRVVLRVLPKLQDYASSIRHRVKSRHWGGSHDGVSVFVDKVEKIKKGEARLKGKSGLKTNTLFLHERNRKNDMKKKQDEPVQYVRKGRVKKSPRVMRMFQIRSEMKNKDS